MENAIDVLLLSREFQFLELERQVGEFVSENPHVEVVWLKSVMSDLQRQLMGHDQELSVLAEANGRARAEQDSQLEGLRGAIQEVNEKQQQEREKVSGLQQAVGEVRRQIEDVTSKLSQTEAAMKGRVRPLERAARGLAETADRTSRVESDVAGLQSAVADGNAKIEEVEQEVAGVKAHLSESYPKVDQALTNLERELAKLKVEMRAMRPKVTKAAKDIDLAAEQCRGLGRDICTLEEEIGGLREATAISSAKLKEGLASIEQQAKDGQRESQEREVQAMADVRDAIGLLGAQLEAVVDEGGHQVLAAAEMQRENERLRAEVGGMRMRVEELEQDNRRVSEANEVIRQNVGRQW
jgi:chromosome segregation ATPase